MKKQIRFSKNKFLRQVITAITVLLVANFIIGTFMHLYVTATSCMTTQQVANDSRCLYIMGGQIYQKDSRAAPHHDHPCGTDVTSVVPADHLANPAIYLIPNHIASVCTAPTPTPRPTATPTPKATPTPTLKPTTTPTPTQSVTAPIHHTTVVPTHTLVTAPIPTATPTSTPTIAISTPVSNPTVVPTIPMNTPSPTTGILSPTPTVIISPDSVVLNLAVSLAGISEGGNNTPVHGTRNATINMYRAFDNPSTSQPIISQTDTLSFDANTTSPTHTLFTNSTFVLGVIPKGKYQFWLVVSGYTKKILTNALDNSTLFSLSGGKTIQIPKINLVAGDLDGNNIVDIADYNALIRCYGNNALTSLCTNASLADLNDDGKVDFIDYNIFLYNLRIYKQENNVLPPNTPAPVAISPTPTQPQPTVTRMNMALSPTKTVLTTKPTQVLNPTVKPVSKNISFVKTIVAGMTNIALITKTFDILVFLVLLVTVGFGLYKSKLLQSVVHKPNTIQQQTSQQKQVHPIADAMQSEIPRDTLDMTFFIKPYKLDEKNGGQWLQLVDNDEKIFGYYKGNAVKEGFAQVKGSKTISQGKPYIAITELIPID